jgi:hypothetical protein
VRHDLSRSADARGFCFSYSPLDRSRVLNASLLGAETVARSAAAAGDPALVEEVRPAVAWVLARQGAEGGWVYGEAGHHAFEDGLHTGFVLTSLRAVREAAASLGIDPDRLVATEALSRGASHYSRHFFDTDGRPWYYRHTPWPIDTHTAAVGVLALRAASAFAPALREQSGRVLDWTLGNLTSPRGGFLFQRRRSHSVDIPYLRWCDAWMLLALADAASAS